MTISLKHTFTSAKSDGADSTLVQPSNWNAEHTMTAAAGKVIGRDTSGAGAIQELPIAVDTSGKVGIGTNAPNAKLHVYGSSSANSNIRLTNTLPPQSWEINPYTTGDSDTKFAIRDVTAAADRITIDSGGNVGVGYITPKARLQTTAGVNLNAPSLGSATNAPFYVTNTDTTYGLLAGTNASDGHVWLQAQRTDGTATAYNITLNEAGGNVGIGTTSPAAKLDVAGGGNVILSGATTGDQYLRVGAGRSGDGFSFLDLQGDATYSTGLRLIRGNTGANSPSSIEHRGTGVLRMVTQEAAPIVFYTQGLNERMRIDSAGNVGIGTSAPGVKLDVAGDIRSTSGNIYAANGGAYTWGGSTAYMSGSSATNVITFATASTERLRIDSAGNLIQQSGVYFAMTAPASKSAAATLTGAEVVQGYVQYTGAAANLTLPTATNLQTALPTDVAALNDIAFDFTIINTGSGTATLVVNTGITAVGALTTAASTSTTFHIRKTATNTFIVYRT